MTTTITRMSIAIVVMAFLTAACQRPRVVQKPSPAALEIAVRAAFDANPDAKGATQGVYISVNNGTITLSGTADTAADKLRAEEIARKTNGVTNVVNQIVVAQPTPRSAETNFDEKAVRAEAARSGERIGTSSADARIYDAVRRKLVARAATPKEEIFLDVVNANVTLRGMVFTSAARQEAVVLARKTPGVNAVNDKLLVNTTIP